MLKYESIISRIRFLKKKISNEYIISLFKSIFVILIHIQQQTNKQKNKKQKSLITGHFSALILEAFSVESTMSLFHFVPIPFF